MYEEGSPFTSPDEWFGNYLLPGVAEGMVIELADSSFRFPHPSMSLDALLGK